MLDMWKERFDFTKNDSDIIDPVNNPIHKAFQDYHLSRLLNDKHSIEFDSDTVFIVGLSYFDAIKMFGGMVGDFEQTLQQLTYYLEEMYDFGNINFEDVTDWLMFCARDEENIEFDFKTKENIQNWLIDKKSLITFLNTNIKEIGEIMISENDLLEIGKKNSAVPAVE